MVCWTTYCERNTGEMPLKELGTSLRLRRSFQPGQHLTIKLPIPGESKGELFWQAGQSFPVSAHEVLGEWPSCEHTNQQLVCKPRALAEQGGRLEQR